MTTHQDTSTERDLVARMRSFEVDHEPDGWPAVRMRDINALCDEIERLRAALASRDEAAVPTLYVSQVQLQGLLDGKLPGMPTPDDKSGTYLPVRLTPWRQIYSCALPTARSAAAARAGGER